jgi:hypothetical protein
MSLEHDIRACINKHSAERGSNTPDFVLARFLVACLGAFNTATREREQFYSVAHEPGLKPTLAGSDETLHCCYVYEGIGGCPRPPVVEFWFDTPGNPYDSTHACADHIVVLGHGATRSNAIGDEPSESAEPALRPGAVAVPLDGPTRKMRKPSIPTYSHRRIVDKDGRVRMLTAEEYEAYRARAAQTYEVGVDPTAPEGDRAVEQTVAVGVSKAESDVLAERQKQRTKWSAEHDDEHMYGHLRVVAAILAVNGTDARVVDPLDRVADDTDGRGGQHDNWGLSKKHAPRQRLVVAAALLLAEIERIDRKGGA